MDMPSNADPARERLAALMPSLDEKRRRGVALQVALDRAGFSPGAIDGMPGQNTDRAAAAFRAARGGGDLGPEYENPVVQYTVTADDVAGLLTAAIPDDLMQQAELQALGYTSVLERLAERFHADPDLLKALNPNASFAEGEVITVPNVEPFVLPTPGGAPRATASTNGTREPAQDRSVSEGGGRTGGGRQGAVTVVVTERSKTLQVHGANGEILFHAPVTTGSEHDPLPVGEWVVNGVSRLPVFHYNPKLFWDADPSHAKAKIAPGPNNPVGVVWIDLSKEHYGIHGTPEPSRVGYTESHGCIRLTNWDAMRVAALVSPGTKVVLR